MVKSPPPGGHPHSDRRNFTLQDYLEMCRAGEAKFTMAEAAHVAGVSRAKLYLWIEMANAGEELFEAALESISDRGLRSTTAVCDEIRRREGQAKEYAECCPHCGGDIRTRRRGG